MSFVRRAWLGLAWEEPVRRQSEPHLHSVRDHHANSQLIQDLNGSTLGARDCSMSFQHFWRSRTQANRIGLSFEIVHRKSVEVPIRRFSRTGGPDRMRVIVDGLNARGLRGDFWVDAGPGQYYRQDANCGPARSAGTSMAGRISL